MTGWAEDARRELFRKIPALDALRGYARLEAEQVVEAVVEDAMDAAVDDFAAVRDEAVQP